MVDRLDSATTLLDLNTDEKPLLDLERGLLATSLNQVVTRIFGITSIPAPITSVAPVVAKVARERGATVTQEVLPRPVAGIKLTDMDCGFGHRETIFVVGGVTLPNTFLIRQDWWKGRIGDAKNASLIMDALREVDPEGFFELARGKVRATRRKLRKRLVG
jgi:hypothetical protein